MAKTLSEFSPDDAVQKAGSTPSVLAPAAAAPATPAAAPTGIIASAQAPVAAPATAAPAAAPTGIIGAAQAAPVAAPAAAPTDYSGQIQGAYQKYLNRTGDQAGVDFYQNAMRNGASMDTVNNDFTSSNEYKSLHPVTPLTDVTPGTTQIGNPTQWNVDADQTVQGQMTKMADPNNPYYQQWATAGAQDAAARGFTGNSSIRSTGIMDSVMRNATPIATADAATNAKAAGYNADMPNQFAQKNADMSQQNSLAHLSADTQKYVADQSAATQMAVQKMSTQSQATISQAHDANSVLIASNDAAKSAYSNYVGAIAQIDQNDKMDATAKQAAITTQTQIFNNAVAGLKAATPGTADVSSPLDVSGTNPAAAQVGGVDVSKLLDFKEVP